EGVEINLVVAEPLEVFEPATAGADVEGEVQDMVGFVVGEMDLQELDVVVDGGDQAGPLGQQEHGPDAARGQTLDTLAEFVVDVAGGDHGVFPLGSGSMGDALAQPPLPLLEEPSLAFTAFAPLASWGLPREKNCHSKPSGTWTNADL